MNNSSTGSTSSTYLHNLLEKEHPKHLHLSQGLPGKICLTCFALRILSASHSLKTVPLQCNSAYSTSPWVVFKAPLCSTRVHGDSKRAWSSLHGCVCGLCCELRSVLRSCVQPWSHFTDQFSATMTPATPVTVADSLILLRGACLIFLSRWTFFGHGSCLLTESSFWSIPLLKKKKQYWTGKGMQLHSSVCENGGKMRTNIRLAWMFANFFRKPILDMMGIKQKKVENTSDSFQFIF